MNIGMNHDEAFAELDAVAFDLLDGPERNAVLSHVEMCRICRPELDARRAMVADLAFAAPLATDTPSGGRARIRDRLMARAGLATQPHHVSGPTASPPPFLIPTPSTPMPTAEHVALVSKWRRAEWIALAASILLVLSIGVLGLTIADRNELRTAVLSQASLRDRVRREVDSLAIMLASRDSVIAGLSGRDVSVMTLTSTTAKEPFARMYWDRSRHSWTFIARNMPALDAGRTYQLWLVTTRSKISAGTFTTHNGDAMMVAHAALADPLASVAVTEEPEGGVAQPTGAVIVAAQR